MQRLRRRVVLVSGWGTDDVGAAVAVAGGNERRGKVVAARFDKFLKDANQRLGNETPAAVGDILSGSIPSPTGPGTFGPFFRFIPPVIRDHLQASYWRALTPLTGGAP
jgi:hypothetical protein